jgi:hypothetical protein
MSTTTDAEKQAAYEYLRAQRRTMIADLPPTAPAEEVDLATIGCPSPEECMANGCSKACMKEAAPVADAGTRAGAILRQAAEIVDGARNVTHGDKERSFRAIARLWDAYLTAKPPVFDIGKPIVTAADVAAMMVLLKFARSEHGQHVDDHGIDAAGYAAIWGELREAAGG